MIWVWCLVGIQVWTSWTFLDQYQGVHQWTQKLCHDDIGTMLSSIPCCWIPKWWYISSLRHTMTWKTSRHVRAELGNLQHPKHHTSPQEKWWWMPSHPFHSQQWHRCGRCPPWYTSGYFPQINPVEVFWGQACRDLVAQNRAAKTEWKHQVQDHANPKLVPLTWAMHICFVGIRR